MLPQEQLLRRGRALLCAARSGEAAWDELRFDEAAPAAAHERSARAREPLAWALQLDCAEADDASAVAALAVRAARTLGRTAAVARYESKLAGARARQEAELKVFDEA